MALIAVIIPTSAIIPNAIMATVSPVRSLLLRTVRQAREKISRKLICEKNGLLVNQFGACDPGYPKLKKVKKIRIQMFTRGKMSMTV